MRVKVDRVSMRFGESEVLRDVSLEFESGQMTVIIGPSGSGKSTLLGIIAGVVRQSSGTVVAPRIDPTGTPAFCWIPQGFNSLPHRTAGDNAALAALAAGLPRWEALQRSEVALAAVGLAARSHAKALALSGGELQRVAVARALASGSPCLLADEPTGNLDAASSTAVIDSLVACVAHERAVVVATHDRRFLDAATQVIDLGDR